MPSRRKFLALLLSRTAGILAVFRRDPAKRDNEQPKSEQNSPGKYQFGLGSILILVTVLCVCLGLLVTNLPLGVGFGVFATFVLIALYRSRIRTSIGDANYRRIAATLLYIGGAMSGAVLGGICGGIGVYLFLAVLPDLFTGFMAIALTAAVGAILGIIYPRVAIAILSLGSGF
jgi:hypothetical protein